MSDIDDRVGNPEFWHLGSYEYPFYRSQFQSLFLSYTRKFFLILDAGCGPDGGYFTTVLKNIQGVGLDISRMNIEKSIKISKKNGNNALSFVVGDIENMPFREDTFDLAICQDVLEHIKDKEKAISDIAFSLKKGGKTLISTTNAFNPAMFIDDILPKIVSEHIIRFFGGPQYYERNRRLNPWSLIKLLVNHRMIVRRLLLTGIPPIGQPWIYQYSNTKLPVIFYLWIVFNKLTDFPFFENLKEIMLVAAEK